MKTTPAAKVTAITTSSLGTTTVDLDILNNYGDHGIAEFDLSPLGEVRGAGGTLATAWAVLGGPCLLPVGATLHLTPKPSPNPEAIAASIREAMVDYLSTGRLSRHNPAIMADTDGAVYYGSAIGQPEDCLLWDLQEGLGAWTPDPGDDLGAISQGAAAMIADLKA